MLIENTGTSTRFDILSAEPQPQTPTTHPVELFSAPTPHEVISQEDPDALSTIRYLISRVPSTFPALKITSNVEKDKYNWIKRDDLVTSIEKAGKNPEENNTTLNYLESLNALKPRLIGNDITVAYGQADTITALYALKLQQSTPLKGLPEKFWPTLRMIVEQEIQEKRAAIINIQRSLEGKKTNSGMVNNETRHKRKKIYS